MVKQLCTIVLGALMAWTTGAVPTGADGPDPTHISADATWFVYIDVHSAINSGLGRYVLEHHAGWNNDVQDIRSELGIDPTEDIDTILAYGGKDGREAVIAHGTSALDDLVATLREQDAPVHEEVVDGHEIQVWQEGALHLRRQGDGRMIVMGDNAADVLAALHVLDGRAAGLDDIEGQRFHLEAERGVFVMAEALDLGDLEGFSPPSQVIRGGKSARMWIGERDDTAFGRVDFHAEDERTANGLVKIFEGLVALGQFAAQQEGQVAQFESFMERIAVEAKGNVVSLRMEIPVDELGQEPELEI